MWEAVIINNMDERTNMKFDINSLIEHYFPIVFGGHEDTYTVTKKKSTNQVKQKL